MVAGSPSAWTCTGRQGGTPLSCASAALLANAINTRLVVRRRAARGRL